MKTQINFLKKASKIFFESTRDQHGGTEGLMTAPGHSTVAGFVAWRVSADLA